MFETLETINVWVFFKDKNIVPYLFYWNSRQVKITNVNLVHTSKVGNKVFYHFSVSSGQNFYKLRFDSFNLKWFLEAVEEG